MSHDSNIENKNTQGQGQQQQASQWSQMVGQLLESVVRQDYVNKVHIPRAGTVGLKYALALHTALPPF